MLDSDFVPFRLTFRPFSVRTRVLETGMARQEGPQPAVSGVAVSDLSAVRVCARCHVAKPLAEFQLKNPSKGWYRSYCRPCASDYGKEHYRQNLVAYLGRNRIRRTLDRPRNRRLVADYLADHPCIDCGEADSIVLEFDHRDPATKSDDVGRIVHTGTAVAVRAEIEKCDVRCGNCHRRRTLIQFGSYRVWMAADA